MSTSNWIDDERSPPGTKRNGKHRRLDRRFGYTGAIDARIIRDVHLMVNAHRARIGLKAWDFKGDRMGMRPMIQWCAACWMDKDRVLAVTNLNGVALCKPCASVFADDAESLARLKKDWEKLPDTDDGPESRQMFENLVSKATTTATTTRAATAVVPAPVTATGSVHAPGKSKTLPSSNSRWDDTLAILRSLKFGDTLTLTPDINDHIKFANQLRSMIHNRKLSKEADYGVSTYTDDGKQTGKVYVSKHEHGWADQQPFKEEWRGKRANHMETSVAVEKTTTMHSEKVTATIIGADSNEKDAGPLATSVVPSANGDGGSNEGSNGAGDSGVQTECMTTLFLSSGGAIRLIFAGDMFAMSKRDREFVYSLVDRIEGYRNGKDSGDGSGNGSDGNRLKPHTQKDGEKLYPVLLTRSCLEDIYNDMLADNANEESIGEHMALIAAWYRGDPAVKPPKVDK